ncbi:MAG: hypothetical protein IPJ39_21135 [Saprospiraceae bacterium]|nr:hypothetical protein [Saprospiraceae bacterium]
MDYRWQVLHIEHQTSAGLFPTAIMFLGYETARSATVTSRVTVHGSEDISTLASVAY